MALPPNRFNVDISCKTKGIPNKFAKNKYSIYTDNVKVDESG